MLHHLSKEREREKERKKKSRSFPFFSTNLCDGVRIIPLGLCTCMIDITRIDSWTILFLSDKENSQAIVKQSVELYY